MLDKLEVGKTYRNQGWLNTVLYIGETAVFFKEQRIDIQEPPSENTWDKFSFMTICRELTEEEKERYL